MLQTKPKINKQSAGVIAQKQPLIVHDNVIDNATQTINDNIGEDAQVINAFHAMESKIFSNISNESKQTGDTFKIDNFNLNEITKKYNDDEIFKNISVNDKKLIISINEKLGKISVLDENNNTIGYFTIQHILKYLGGVYDSKNQLLTELDISAYKKAKELIKSLVVKMNYNKINKYVILNLHDYNSSAFMSDIEVLVKFNNLLYVYQKESLGSDLAKIDNKNRIKIEQNFKKFIIMLLSYTLQLIAIVSKKAQNNQELKNQLMEYSIGIVYRINLFVQEQIKVIHTQNTGISETIKKNIDLKSELKSKLETLIATIASCKK